MATIIVNTNGSFDVDDQCDILKMIQEGEE
jgi:hypothetical protein